MRLLIHGAAGRMGQNVINAVNKSNHTIAGAVDVFFNNSENLSLPYDCFSCLDDVNVDFDCIIDFSNHATTKVLLDYAVKVNKPILIATTGQTNEEKDMIQKASMSIPVFYASNMSLGIATLCSLVKTATMMFPGADIEIVEQHHNNKLDVPSGTALTLAQVIQSVRTDSELLVGRHENGKRKDSEIGIHSLRLGNVVGIHEVIITTGNETITLKHEAHDRAVFADGAIVAAEFLYEKILSGCKNGLYSMNDIIEQINN